MNQQIQAGLPAAFVERMRESLGVEADAFFASYETPRAYGLRCNPLKIGRQQLRELVPFALTPVPWAAEGCYYKEGERPGKHPFHEMGLYYIQEPSAMCVAALADPKPGERVLDLCAAPGGKATQLAGGLDGEGLLVCNEPVKDRAKILSRNIERMGVKNAVVLNHTPQELELRFPAFFDKIIVDAPCSGEGMFHKEEAALTEWSPENVMRCAMRQREILASAAAMLRPGGILVYSTCTFAPEENEEMVAWFLAEYPEFHPVEIDAAALGMSRGSVPGTARIYPHRQRGEGHFVARLQKEGAPCVAGSGMAPAKGKSSVIRTVDGGYTPDKAQGSGHTLDEARGSGHTPDKVQGSGHTLDKVQGSGHTLDEARGSGHTPDKAQGSREAPDKAQGSGHTPDEARGSGQATDKARGSGHTPDKTRGSREALDQAKGSGYTIDQAQGGRQTKRSRGDRRQDKKGKGSPEIWQAYEMFAEQTLLEPPQGRREAFGDQLYLIPEEMPDIRGLKVLRPGLHLGTNRKNRFEPSHALALALRVAQVRRCFETGEPEKYLRGETLACDVALEGWTLVTYRGFPMGWGKASRGVMKNHYPKGLRVNL